MKGKQKVITSKCSYAARLLQSTISEMEVPKGFYDLSVPYQSNESELIAILNELYEVGYRTVAIDQTFDHTKCSRKITDVFPVPADIKNLQEKFQNKLTILNRLSIVYSQSVLSHDMNISLNLKKYNLICGIPITEAAMQHACSTFTGDIIGMVFDDTTKVFLISHKYYMMAARRGIYFEIQYAPAIRNSNQRKDIIVVAQNIVSHRKAKCIMMSGGALNAFQVRSPYDVANLCLIFGLSEEQSKSAISNVCWTIRFEYPKSTKLAILSMMIETFSLSSIKYLEENRFWPTSANGSMMTMRPLSRAMPTFIPRRAAALV